MNVGTPELRENVAILAMKSDAFVALGFFMDILRLPQAPDNAVEVGPASPCQKYVAGALEFFNRKTLIRTHVRAIISERVIRDLSLKRPGRCGNTDRARHPMRLTSNDDLRVRRINVEPSVRVFRCRKPSVSSIQPGDRVMASLTEFHASIADVTNEEHQNMAGLVQLDDFNAEVVVRFLGDNGIDARVDESTGGFRYAAADASRASHALFACVCLRASMSYAIEAAYWCLKAKR